MNSRESEESDESNTFKEKLQKPTKNWENK